MLTLVIAITRNEPEEEGGEPTFTARTDNIANEEGSYERTCGTKGELKEIVGDMAWLAVTNFEAEEARRKDAEEDEPIEGEIAGEAPE